MQTTPYNMGLTFMHNIFNIREERVVIKYWLYERIDGLSHHLNVAYMKYTSPSEDLVDLTQCCYNLVLQFYEESFC